jgi:hypothetical protein
MEDGRGRMDEGRWTREDGRGTRDDRDGMVKTWMIRMIRMGEERMEAVEKEGEKMRGWEGGKR